MLLKLQLSNNNENLHCEYLKKKKQDMELWTNCNLRAQLKLLQNQRIEMTQVIQKGYPLLI